eukprot:GILK01005980.1.p1 GENE.GILK01005980.1~~GILK01005980.1.p1  ORF type:complete len:212 (-),score=24.85 GILK01005980.1:859-1494(-)
MSKYHELREVRHGLFPASPSDLNIPMLDDAPPTPKPKKRLLFCSAICLVIGIAMLVVGYVVYPRQPEWDLLCTRRNYWTLSEKLPPKVDISMSAFFKFRNVNVGDIKILKFNLDMFHWGKRIGVIAKDDVVFPAKQKSVVHFDMNITRIGVTDALQLWIDSKNPTVRLDFAGNITVQYLKLTKTQHLEFSQDVDINAPQPAVCPPPDEEDS